MTMVLFALSSRVSPRFWLLLCLRRRLLLIDSPWRILEYDGRGVVMAIFGNLIFSFGWFGARLGDEEVMGNGKRFLGLWEVGKGH